jgi:TonB-linked SusC/RagA family outer membrane protein
MNFTAFYKAIQRVLLFPLQLPVSVSEMFRGHPVLFKRILMRINITTLVIVLALVQASASTYGQKISLNEKNAPVEKVLTEIKKQSGYVFFYDNNDLKEKTISIQIKDADIKDVLDGCFKELPLTYEIENKTILIKQKVPPSTKSKNVLAPQSSKEIDGQVFTEHNEPIAGATVTIKRTKTGTITDANGFFLLKSILSSDTLVVSFIGYKTKQVPVTEKVNYPVVLQESVSQLDQVVVQAYTQTTERLNTGDIGTVTAKEISQQPVLNPLLALQGKIPGVVVTQTSGFASAPIKVEIRGRNSIDNGFTGEPLYIVDGVPLSVVELGGSNYNSGSTGFLQSNISSPAGGQSPLFSINPSDVESISVLKDADATAIYGSRGANGVILITTKKGKAGSTQVSVNAYEGIEKVTNHYQLLNTQQYLDMRREAFKNDGITPTIANAPDLLLYDQNRYTDWQNALWGRVGNAMHADLGISGGNEQTTFRVSGTYDHSQQIQTISGANQKASFSFNLSHSGLNQKLRITFTGNYSYATTNEVNISNIVTLPPNAPAIYDAQGNLNYAQWDTYSAQNSSIYFPFAALKQQYSSSTNFFNGALNLSYQIVKGLSFSTNLGYNLATGDQLSLQPIVSQDPQTNPTASSSFGRTSNHNVSVQPQLSYHSLVSKGNLNAFIAASYQETATDVLNVTGQGYTNDGLIRSISNAPTQFASDSYGQYKFLSLFSQIGYNWEDKYLINFSGRRDGSSNFGANNQFGNFGAIGAAWIFTQEDWLKDKLSFLSFGKLRGSYGTTGGDAQPYGYLSRWTDNNNPSYSGYGPLQPIQHANPNYQWQVNKKIEGALDLGFFKDRIFLEVAYYRDRVNNQLVTEPLPALTGFTGVEANSPASVQNQGWEFSVTTKIIDQDNVKWSVNFNGSLNKNKLLAFPNLALTPYSGQYIVGQSLNITRLLHYTGVDPQTGLYTYEDKNHDGVINTNQQDPKNDLFVYDLNPKFTGGFGTNFSYKKFQLSMFFQVVTKINQNALFTGYSPGQFNTNQANQSTSVLNRWQKPGDIAQYAKFTTNPAIADPTNNGASYGNFINSDANYTDGSYIRLSNASLSYTLPDKWVRPVGIKSCSIFMRANDLFVITKFKGLDPEVSTFGTMPPAKTIVGGVSFTF